MLASPARATARPPLRPRWVPAERPDAAAVAALASRLGAPQLVAELLILRGHAEEPAARAFLRPDPSQLLRPSELAGMQVAAGRVAAAIRAGESILVHGDYDVDGICGTALLVRAFTMMGGRCTPFVPDRIRDGYDLTGAGVEAARKAGATLIVTTDCGIVAHDAVTLARGSGIDVVVTDHHTPGVALPPALAVVNPNRTDCRYLFKGLAGAGVAYKLAMAVAMQVGFPGERLAALLDLVALATIADLAPLTVENRVLCRWGLSILPRTPNPGLRALIRRVGLADSSEISAGQVGFVLAPRLNAVGRIGDPMIAVRLLLTDDAVEANRLAAAVEEHNVRRQGLDEDTLADARRLLHAEYDPDRDWGVVLASADWYPGVIGIVASRLVEELHRPVVLIATGTGEGRGSARSIRALHLHQAFTACAGHLIRFGGHRAAAGCSIEPHRIGDFRRAFNEQVRMRLTAADLVPELRIDLELSVAEANETLVRILDRFSPFGIGNPSPVFCARGVAVEGAPKVVGGGHLKLAVRADDARLEAIGFGMGTRAAEVREARRIDIAFRLEANAWVGSNGRERRTVQARLLDLRAAC